MGEQNLFHQLYFKMKLKNGGTSPTLQAESYNIGKKHPIILSGYELSGFAIKRLGAFKQQSNWLEKK